MGDAGGLQQAKLVLLGDMGAGKSSLVLRFVKGQFFDYQVRTHVTLLLRFTCVSCELGSKLAVDKSFASICNLFAAAGVNNWRCLSYQDNARTKREV